MFCFTARVQPIISSSHPMMIADHFLPIAKKIRDNAMIVEQKEKQLMLAKLHQTQTDDDSDMEADVQLVSVAKCSYFARQDEVMFSR